MPTACRRTWPSWRRPSPTGPTACFSRRSFIPAALRPPRLFGASGVAPGASVHPDGAARGRRDVSSRRGGRARAPRSARGTIIAAGAVIGRGGARSAATASSAPTRRHPACADRQPRHHPSRRRASGRTASALRLGAGGHLKVPQVGRVIIQDDVEIGANTTIDRGANRDTVIGEGTKIDNLVQIAHNVEIGRHCVHRRAGRDLGQLHARRFRHDRRAGRRRRPRRPSAAGAQIAAVSGVMHDVPAGARWGGTPAQPVQEWFREMATLRRLAAARLGDDDWAGDGRRRGGCRWISRPRRSRPPTSPGSAGAAAPLSVPDGRPHHRHRRRRFRRSASRTSPSTSRISRGIFPASR